MIDTEKIQPPGQGDAQADAARASGSASRWTSAATRAWSSDRFVLRAVTDEVMYEIMKLSGQEYVDIYATAAKRQIAEAAKAEKLAEKQAQKALEKERSGTK